MLIRPTLLLGLLCAVLCACGSRRALDPPAPDRQVDTALGSGIRPAALFVEPADPVRRLIRAIDQTQDHLFVEAYILTDRAIVHALERAAAQGVSVYILLEPHPYGMGTQPQRIADELRAAGMAVRWTRPDVPLTHAKFLVLDDRLAVISTANLSRSAFTHNREFLVTDRNPADVRAVSVIFRADWDRKTASLDDPNLLVSPSNARVKLTAMFAAAQQSIDLYAEEIADRPIERLLAAEARRGVRVRVILAQGATPGGAQAMRRGRIALREMASPYIHAKAIVVDRRIAFVGSENLSTQSLDRNREVGVLLRGRAVRTIEGVFEKDWRRAHP